MESNSICIVIAVCVFTFIVRTLYEILKHRKLVTAGRISFIIILINMLLLWISWFALGQFDSHTISMPAPVKYAGVVFIVSGIVIFLISLCTIRSLETYQGDLITRGIYSRFRHPMYFSFILWIIGNAMYGGSVSCIVLSIPFISAILSWRYLEERELERRFADYEEYKKTTLF